MMVIIGHTPFESLSQTADASGARSFVESPADDQSGCLVGANKLASLLACWPKKDLSSLILKEPLDSAVSSEFVVATFVLRQG